MEMDGAAALFPATLPIAPVGRVPFGRDGGLPFPGQFPSLPQLGGNRGLFLPGPFTASGLLLELHPTGTLGQPFRGNKFFHHIAPKIRVEPCQPLSIRDAALVLPFPHHLGLGIHQPPHIRVITGWLELVVIFEFSYFFNLA